MVCFVETTALEHSKYISKLVLLEEKFLLNSLYKKN